MNYLTDVDNQLVCGGLLGTHSRYLCHKVECHEIATDHCLQASIGGADTYSSKPLTVGHTE